jgi:CcmD family protein
MPAELPATGGYMVAAYVVAGTILLGYFLSLLRRAKRILKQRER